MKTIITIIFLVAAFIAPAGNAYAGAQDEKLKQLTAQEAPWQFIRYCIAGIWTAEDTLIKVPRITQDQAQALCSKLWEEAKGFYDSQPLGERDNWSCGSGLGTAVLIHNRREVLSSLEDNTSAQDFFDSGCKAQALHPSLQTPRRERFDLLP